MFQELLFVCFLRFIALSGNHTYLDASASPPPFKRLRLAKYSFCALSITTKRRPYLQTWMSGLQKASFLLFERIHDRLSIPSRSNNILGRYIAHLERVGTDHFCVLLFELEIVLTFWDQQNVLVLSSGVISQKLSQIGFSEKLLLLHLITF